MNTQLRPGVAVLSLTQVPDDFHARFSATGRAYRYRVLNREAPDPFIAATSYHYRTPLDINAMREGCQVLPGIHDFASFCRAAPGRSTERDLRVAEWEEHPNGVKELYIAASSFCHQMVRSIVAVSLDIGRGKLAPSAMGEILEARDRRAGCGASPAHGLTLVSVEY